MKKLGKSAFVSIVFGVAIGALGTGTAAAQSLPGIGAVMTYNVNEGSDFLQVQSATTIGEFLIGVGQIVQQVQATNPPERMQAVARQILTIRPQLVSLQEVDQWYGGAFDPIAGTCGPLTLQFDMLQALLDALAAAGGHYQVAVKVIQYAFPPTPGLIPPSAYICAAVNNYNVVLARTDLPSWAFSWTNPQTGQFANMVTLPSPAGPIPLPRSWASVDAQFFGHSNSQASPLPQDGTYLDFIAAGYSDAWSRVFPFLPGFTCCQDEADNNPVSQLSQRIDLILTKGGIAPLGIALLGADSRSRLPDGLWPSDHAAVVAGVIVGK